MQLNVSGPVDCTLMEKRPLWVIRSLIVSELVQLQEPAAEPLPSNPIAGLASANQRALDTALGAQGLIFEEVVFMANELLDRTQTETHLFAEFVSKLAGSHSVKDWTTMYRECSQHQLDFIRRDCDRYFRHGERVAAAILGMLNERPRLTSAVADGKSETPKNIQP
ncbi:hypothetical protein BcanWSM471_26860 [Bradyrhizobium sp. WSM471]|nr:MULTISPECIES: hypothetical protein [Bradyrhizobium]EHR04670.1 hypothetical protein Bra471DRAFT_05474 [Bradyrhizobium sp. WSM471]UFW45077.1 hypothetical protein BcanWSM471_26860 [Bradyrhizobium canariense]